MRTNFLLYIIVVAGAAYTASCSHFPNKASNRAASDEQPVNPYDWAGPHIDSAEIEELNKPLAALLIKVVTENGFVRWELFERNDDHVCTELATFIETLRCISPDTTPTSFPDRASSDLDAQQKLDASTAPHRTAYWVNAYNALSMDWVIRHHYPATIPQVREGCWNIGGRDMSLDEIGNKVDEDVRIFLLNSCAYSAAPLRAQPYVAFDLLHRLSEQTHRYLRDRRAIRRVGDTIEVNDLLIREKRSIILQRWAVRGDIDEWRSERVDSLFLTVLAHMASVPAKPWGKYKLGRLGFDWSLNRPPEDLRSLKRGEDL